MPFLGCGELNAMDWCVNRPPLQHAVLITPEGVFEDPSPRPDGDVVLERLAEMMFVDAARSEPGQVEPVLSRWRGPPCR